MLAVPRPSCLSAPRPTHELRERNGAGVDADDITDHRWQPQRNTKPATEVASGGLKGNYNNIKHFSFIFGSVKILNTGMEC